MKPSLYQYAGACSADRGRALQRLVGLVAVLASCIPTAAWGQSGWPAYPNNSVISVASSGNVGIGTATPMVALDVNGIIQVNNSETDMLTRLMNSSGGIQLGMIAGTPYIGLVNNLPASWRSNWIKGNANNADVYVGLDGGKVGIGTTTPTARLEVAGSLNAIKTTVNSGQVMGLEMSRPAGQYGYIRASTSSVPRWDFGVTDGAEGGSNAGSDFFFNSWADDGSYLGMPLFIKRNSGNVGIGTTDPGGKLQVNGNAIIGDDLTAGSYLNIVGAGADQYFGVQLGTENNPDAKAAIRAYTSDNTLRFYTADSSVGSPQMVIGSSGNVGIGTTDPQHRLHVAGTIGATEVIVSSTGADYVFDPSYRLRPLDDVAAYIRTNQHLPDFPSATSVQHNGVGIGEMQTKLLAKIEELTLYVIKANERNKELERRLTELEARNAAGAKQ